jgi:asparagine synthase (glutamine-hydrolysing)
MARHLDWRARTPDRWDARLLRLWRSRYRALQSSTLDLLATDAGARVVNVFMEPSVVRALARRFGMRGPLDRTAAMAELFGHLLPDEVVTRRSKAFFDEAYLNDYTREFAASWTGAGVDLTLVDPDQLASEWRSARPSPQSALLLQHTWLAADV